MLSASPTAPGGFVASVTLAMSAPEIAHSGADAVYKVANHRTPPSSAGASVNSASSTARLASMSASDGDKAKSL